MLTSIEVEEWLRPEAESPRDCREKKQNKQISQRLFRADTNSEWDQVGRGCGEAVLERSILTRGSNQSE